MSNKSGFELRTDILGMASSLLESNRHQHTNQFFALSDEDRAGKTAPVMEITAEEVIRVARELYDFVNEK